MKKIITMFVIAFVAVSMQAKDVTFADQYLKLRKSNTDRFIMVDRLNKKEIKKRIVESEADHSEELTAEEKLQREQINSLMKYAKEVIVVMDGEDVEDFDTELKLLNSGYEVLMSTEEDNVTMSLMASFQGDKVKEVIVGLYDRGKVNFFADVLFKSRLCWRIILQ